MARSVAVESSSADSDALDSLVGNRVKADIFALTSVECKLVSINEAGATLEVVVGTQRHVSFYPWGHVARISSVTSTAARPTPAATASESVAT